MCEECFRGAQCLWDNGTAGNGLDLLPFTSFYDVPVEDSLDPVLKGSGAAGALPPYFLSDSLWFSQHEWQSLEEQLAGSRGKRRTGQRPVELERREK